MDTLSLIPLPAVRGMTGDAKSTTYKAVQEGRLPTPVHTASASSRWVYGEIRQIVLSRIAGRTDDEIRVLVSKMIAARSSPDYVALLEAVEPPIRAKRKASAEVPA